MNHTAGFTYSFMNSTPVDAYYNDKALVFPGSPEPLDVLVDRLAEAPLLCQPGTQWNYSVATDVLGRLVEVWSGESLAEVALALLKRPRCIPVVEVWLVVRTTLPVSVSAS